ncbi:hypothetical protein D3C75_777800 [compost metagenome]
MACIRRLLLVASFGVPPTNFTIAGDDAIANPPTPAVSVMALSPRSAAASSTPYPGKNKPSTGFAGAWNHWSPRPDKRIPKFTPLRAITVTIELNGTFAAASIIDLQAVIDKLRKK